MPRRRDRERQTQDRELRERERLDRMAAVPFSYPEVGATAATLPAGYRHVDVERRLGRGADCFRLAADRLLTWKMHHRAGLSVLTGQPTARVGQVAVLGIRYGPIAIQAPVRILDVVDEPSVRGFTYGTLAGHPECGEERFLVHHDPDDTVRATVRAFSRPARWYTRIGAPVARYLQDATTARYLDALCP